MQIHYRGALDTLRRHPERERGVFPVGNGCAVTDPRIAQEVNADNYRGATIPDRLVDVLRGRPSATVAWQEVRACWAAQLKRLTEPDALADLDARLRSLIDARLDRELDLSWAIQEIFTQALIPTVLADLTARERARIWNDQQSKLDRLMRPRQREDRAVEKLRSAWVQIKAGRVARQVLRQRARGRRPRRVDLADPIVDLLPRLGMDRASHAVTTVLTAISGPPGAVAVCTLLELTRRRSWAARLEAEHARLSTGDFLRSVGREAPETQRFTKECLRVWSAPLVLTRVARRPLAVASERLDEGDLFHLSPFLAHHDPVHWPDPERFDPDRWRAGSAGAPRAHCAYAPFGWAPTTCIGAGIGSNELMMLCRLFSDRYRIEVEQPDAIEILMASVPLPMGFRGVLRRR